MRNLLSQDEVHALLDGLKDGHVETRQTAVSAADGCRPYDLTRQERNLLGRLPALDMMNRKLARQLERVLSGALRRTVGVNVLNIDSMKFGEFLTTLPVPTSIHVFRMQPLPGSAILTIEGKLVFTFIDSVFGGPGNGSGKGERKSFTTIESHMIQRIVRLIFAEIENIWVPIEPVRVELERSENDPAFVDIVSSSAPVIITPFEVEVGEARGYITICLPYTTLEPIRAKLNITCQSEHPASDPDGDKRLLQHIKAIKVNASVELGCAEITIRTLLALQAGDIILLDQDCDSELRVCIEGIPKFKGLPRVTKQKKAVEITSRILPPQETKHE